MKILQILSLAFLTAVLGFGTWLQSQAPAKPEPPKYQATPAQSQVLQKIGYRYLLADQNVRTAEEQVTRAKAQRDGTLNELSLACTKVIQENKWPAWVRCSFGQEEVVFWEDELARPKEPPKDGK